MIARPVSNPCGACVHAGDWYEIIMLHTVSGRLRAWPAPVAVHPPRQTTCKMHLHRYCRCNSCTRILIPFHTPALYERKTRPIRNNILNKLEIFVPCNVHSILLIFAVKSFDPFLGNGCIIYIF